MKDNKMNNTDIMELAEATPENATEITRTLVKEGRENACKVAAVLATDEFAVRYLSDELDLTRDEASEMLYDENFNTNILDTLKDIVFVFFTALFEGETTPDRDELEKQLAEYKDYIYDYAYDHNYLQDNSYSYER